MSIHSKGQNLYKKNNKVNVILSISDETWLILFYYFYSLQREPSTCKIVMNICFETVFFFLSCTDLGIE